MIVRWSWRLLNVLVSSFVLLWVGATCVTFSVKYALGVSLGWWGWLFWFGMGLIIAGATKK